MKGVLSDGSSERPNLLVPGRGAHPEPRAPVSLSGAPSFFSQPADIPEKSQTSDLAQKGHW